MNIKKRKFKKIFLNLVITTSVFFQNTVFADEIKTENNESNKEKFIETKWFDNPNDTNLFYIPTARIKKARTGYFKFEKNDISLFIDTNYSITDNISLGLITGVAGFSLAGVVYPKIGFEVAKDLNIAVGIGYGAGVGYSSKLSDLLPVYEVITYGNADNNITTGLLHKIDSLSIVFGGGMYRITKNASIIIETLFIPSMYNYFDYRSSFGMRVFEKNFSFDLAASFSGRYEKITHYNTNSVQFDIITGIVYNF